MNTTRTHNTYRCLRKDGWRVKEAFSHAKDDQRLEDAEEAGLIRFGWVSDDSYDPYFWVSDGGITQEDADKEAKDLDSGYLSAMGCVAEVPDIPAGLFVGGADVPDMEWRVSDSLWGIVGPFDQTDKDYRRSVEIDLAYESGVLK